jgi:hypothetical protein
MTSDESPESRKPTLDAEGFQRLLAAAYILQSHNEGEVRPIGVARDAGAFAATAIHLKRVPFNRGLPRRSGYPYHTKDKSVAPRPTGLRFWKQVEAVAIAVVFCLMMGMSIHRLLASSGHASQDPASLETHEAALPLSPAPGIVTSSQQKAAVQEPVDDRLVIYYRPPAVARKGTSKSGAQISMGRQGRLAASTVVQYGDDVTMWSQGKSSPEQP